jgi:NADPH:quinone reductase-like Zn-dependent oxidoreductase
VDSGEKLEMLRSLGAEAVIDYTKTDFSTYQQNFDVIFDVVGKSHFGRSIRALKENGRYLLANPKLWQMMWAKRAARKSGREIFHQTANPTVKDLEILTGLIEAGKLKTVIDRRYPLEEIAEAHRYVESGQKMGNVVISVVENNLPNIIEE